MLAVSVSTVLWADVNNAYVWVVLLVTIGFGAVGRAAVGIETFFVRIGAEAEIFRLYAGFGQAVDGEPLEIEEGMAGLRNDLYQNMLTELSEQAKAADGLGYEVIDRVRMDLFRQDKGQNHGDSGHHNEAGNRKLNCQVVF